MVEIIIVLVIGLFLLLGLASHEGNMNTWETLWHIYNERKKLELEHKLAMEKEHTKQLQIQNEKKDFEYQEI